MQKCQNYLKVDESIDWCSFSVDSSYSGRALLSSFLFRPPPLTVSIRYFCMDRFEYLLSPLNWQTRAESFQNGLCSLLYPTTAFTRIPLKRCLLHHSLFFLIIRPSEAGDQAKANSKGWRELLSRQLEISWSVIERIIGFKYFNGYKLWIIMFTLSRRDIFLVNSFLSQAIYDSPSFVSPFSCLHFIKNISPLRISK